ncbi:MAG TPA: rhomboid family intramembrane serine protease [Burkholderiaceae bacterium]|nr:rhomboid family intramembrane serine protease [Burkholderiaceae bacterium]
MHFPVPDPAHTDSDQARAHFRLAVRLTCGFVALIWLVYLLNLAFDVDPDPFGVRPREVSGLVGIFLAPLVHGGFSHIAANTLPVLVLGTAMLYLYPSSALRALPVIYLGPGVAVWLFGRGAVHFGASGLVYGLVSYIFFAGLLRRDRRAIAASLIVAFMYGSLTLGFLPLPPEISWETHLAAAIIGALLALALRRFDVLPPKRYAWEDEQPLPPAADDDSTPTHPVRDSGETDRGY